jgi:hypothetical protein
MSHAGLLILGAPWLLMDGAMRAGRRLILSLLSKGGRR